MKRIFAIFLAAFFAFAQDVNEFLLTEADTVEQIAEITEETESVSTVAVENRSFRIFFTGIQTGDIPELRTTLENMIRTRFSSSDNIDFVNETVSARIIHNFFSGRRIVVDSLFFDELEKRGLGNTVVMLINVDEYSINPVRRIFVGAGVEGKLRANILFYDVEARRVLFAAKLSSSYLVKKPPIFWRSLSERVAISADDRRKINSELLDDIVRQSFESMILAVSSKK